MPVTIHMSPEVGVGYGVVDRPRLPLLEGVLQKYPNLYGDLSANSAGQAIMRAPEFGLKFLEKCRKNLWIIEIKKEFRKELFF